MSNFVTGAIGAVRIVPLTVNGNGEVTAIGTKQDYLNTAEESYGISNADQSSQEYYEIELSGDRTLRRPKNVKIIDAITDTEAVSAGGESDDMKCKLLLELSQKTAVIALRNKLILVMMGEYDMNGDLAAMQVMAGKISGKINPAPDNGYLAVSLEIAGKAFTVASGSTVTHAEFNTALTGGSNTITPNNKAAITFPDIDADDWTAIKAGYVVDVVPA